MSGLVRLSRLQIDNVISALMHQYVCSSSFSLTGSFCVDIIETTLDIECLLGPLGPKHKKHVGK